jgi:hypothetical protein
MKKILKPCKLRLRSETVSVMKPLSPNDLRFANVPGGSGGNCDPVGCDRTESCAPN